MAGKPCAWTGMRADFSLPLRNLERFVSIEWYVTVGEEQALSVMTTDGSGDSKLTGGARGNLVPLALKRDRRPIRLLSRSATASVIVR